jgi:ferredoxin
MHLQAYCPTCHSQIELGYIGHLPQPTRLMGTLADIHHGHSCKTLDKQKLSA